MSAFLIDLRIGSSSLFKHRRRSGFLGLAIAAITCLFVLLNALSAGVSNTLIETATTLIAGHLNVIGFYKPNAGQANMVIVDYQQIAEISARALPELDFIAARTRGLGKVVSDSSSLQTWFAGVEIAREPNFKAALDVSAGSADALSQPGAVLLFEGQAARLGVTVGDQVTLFAPTMRGSMNTLDCHVVAIARDPGLLSRVVVFVSDAALRALNQVNGDTTGALQIHLKPSAVEQAPRLAARLKAELERHGYRMLEADPRGAWSQLQAVAGEDWTGQKVGVTTWQEELGSITWTLQVLNALRAGTMLVLFAIMITGIMNMFWVAIRERTREIGALRAIGMQRGSVARMFMTEALLLGALAAVTGVVLGVLLSMSINAASVHVPLSVQLFLMRDTLVLVLQPRELVGAVALITAITCAASVYPSLRAARLQPLHALSHHG